MPITSSDANSIAATLSGALGASSSHIEVYRRTLYTSRARIPLKWELCAPSAPDCPPNISIITGNTEKHRMANISNLRPPWKPGESGNPNGRPIRTRLTEQFVADDSDTWSRHGSRILDDMAKKAG